MKKTISSVIFFVLISTYFVQAQEVSPEADAILTTAESLFQDMQHKDYLNLWEKLSEQSQRTIIHDTYKSIRSQKADIQENRVARGFANGDEISKAYWDAFLKNFDPAIILDQCRWELGKIKKRDAQIKITYKKSDNPAILRMYKEHGFWKVGLTESFWNQKYRF